MKMWCKCLMGASLIMGVGVTMYFLYPCLKKKMDNCSCLDNLDEFEENV